MRLITSTFLLALLIGSASAAQENNGTGLSVGQAANSEPAEGQIYVKEDSGDWLLRCIKRAEGNDPCHLYQLLHEASGNPVSGIVLFPIAPGQQAVAGANVLTPLEPLLQRQLSLSIDGGETRVYPFSFCTRSGCTARLGFTATDLLALERGSTAVLTIYALSAPDTPVEIQVSLKGFPAGCDKLLGG